VNLQNLSGSSEYPIRSIFKSPKDYKWLCLDYNQLELRVASHYGNDKVMIEAFKNSVDIHGQIAKESYNLDCEVNEVKDLYPKVRKRAKQLSFGRQKSYAEKFKSTQNRETRNINDVGNPMLLVSRSSSTNNGSSIKRDFNKLIESIYTVDRVADTALTLKV
jgi:hypothetical protein